MKILYIFAGTNLEEFGLNPVNEAVDELTAKAIITSNKGEIYALADFVMAFNDEYISDLGYIYIIK